MSVNRNTSSRRHFLKKTRAVGLTASAAGLGLSTALSRPAISQSRQRWRMVTSWAKGSAGPGTTADRLGKRITAATDGRVEVEVLGAGELTSPFGVLDAVADGTAEMAHTASFFWAGRVAAATFFTTIPFGLSPSAHNAWIRFGGGQALWDEAYAPLDVKPLLAGNSGANMAGWFKQPLTSMDDLKGVRIRTAGLGGEIYRQLGAATVTLPPSEIFSALQSGAIDAVEFLGPFSDRALGFNQVADNYYFPGFNKPNGTAEALINTNLWTGLDVDLRAAVQNACDAENDAGLAEVTWFNAQALQALGAEGTNIQAMPANIVTAAREAARGVLADFADTNDMTRKVQQSYGQAVAALSAWDEVQG
jgi:TRAP-type mannitol/chloroaromatic compound transport system substrate-binding protein